MKKVLADPSAERAVLSGLITYGDQVYVDVADLLSDDIFTVDSNQHIYLCLKNIFDKQTDPVLDIASIMSSAQELSIGHIFAHKEEIQHLKAVCDFPVDIKNVRKFAAKIKKLEIARSIYGKMDNIKESILDVTGNESVASILGIAEEQIYNLAETLSGEPESAPVSVSSNIEEYVEELSKQVVDQIGIPTGFPVYDQAIGGGLRRGTINVIAARPKTGKTLLADNMGYHIANKLNIPVLNMDTEMSKEDHIHRLLAMITQIELNKIETGKFSDSPNQVKNIQKAVEELKKTNLYYKIIAGKPFDEQLSIMRRWIAKEVGFNSDGTAKECVIFYDYLKLMDSIGMSQDLKEYQVLGFMMTALHNFAVKYKIPIVAFVQLNRDGITKESTDTASGSDRIIWLCSNFSIFKRKTDEEIAQDGPENGNRKLLPVVSRHGGGLDDNDYINCNMQGWCAKITEAQTKLELMNNTQTKQEGFSLDDNTNEAEIPFI
jgi:replicative DNA helicase